MRQPPQARARPRSLDAMERNLEACLMRPDRTGILAVLLCALAVFAPEIACAQCCNDFFSCAAAFLSDGTSCSVSAAADELNAVKKRAEDNKAAAQAERDRLLAVMQEETQRRTADAELESAAKLRSIAANLNATLEAQQAALAPKAKLAVDADIKTETDRALAKLRTLKGEAASEHTKFVTQEVNGLRRTARNAASTMRTAFEASLVAPLVGLLGSLPPPGPLLTEATVAGIAGNLDRIEREGNAAIVRKANEVDAAIKVDADKMAQKLAAQTQRETQAERLADLSQQLLTSRSQADLETLRAALGESVDTERMVPMSEAPFVASNLRLPGPSAVGIIRLAPAASVNAIAPAQLSQFDARARSELATAVSAPDAAGVAKKKAALIAETKKRYAKDPALRDKLIAYIQSAQ
jgi:hypothetical protein